MGSSYLNLKMEKWRFLPFLDLILSLVPSNAQNLKIVFNRSQHGLQPPLIHFWASGGTLWAIIAVVVNWPPSLVHILGYIDTSAYIPVTFKHIWLCKFMVLGYVDLELISICFPIAIVKWSHSIIPTKAGKMYKFFLVFCIKYLFVAKYNEFKKLTCFQDQIFY